MIDNSRVLIEHQLSKNFLRIRLHKKILANTKKTYPVHCTPQIDQLDTN